MIKPKHPIAFLTSAFYGAAAILIESSHYSECVLKFSLLFLCISSAGLHYLGESKLRDPIKEKRRSDWEIFERTGIYAVLNSILLILLSISFDIEPIEGLVFWFITSVLMMIFRNSLYSLGEIALYFVQILFLVYILEFWAFIIAAIFVVAFLFRKAGSLAKKDEPYSRIGDAFHGGWHILTALGFYLIADTITRL